MSTPNFAAAPVNPANLPPQLQALYAQLYRAPAPGMPMPATAPDQPASPIAAPAPPSMAAPAARPGGIAARLRAVAPMGPAPAPAPVSPSPEEMAMSGPRLAKLMPPAAPVNPPVKIEAPGNAATGIPAPAPTATPAAPAGTQGVQGEAEYLAAHPQAHLQPMGMPGAPTLRQALLQGIADAAAGWGRPQVGAQMLEEQNRARAAQAAEAQKFNAELPLENSRLDDAAYQRYLAGRREGATESHLNAVDQNEQTTLEARLRAMGIDPATGNPLPANQLSPLQQANLNAMQSRAALLEAQTAAVKAAQNPNSVQNQLARRRLDIAQEQYQVAAQRLNEALNAHQQEMQQHDEPITDYLAAHHLPDTPENRNYARVHLSSDQAQAKSNATEAAKQADLRSQSTNALTHMKSLAALNTPAANYAFMMNFIGMSYSGVRGARLNQSEITRAGATRSLPDYLQHIYDLAVQRKILTPEQKQQMLQAAEAVVNSYHEPAAAAPATHQFSISAWKQANPNGSVAQAEAQARAAGYEVVN